MKMPQQTLQLYRADRSQRDRLGRKHESSATVARLVGRLTNEIPPMGHTANHAEILQALFITTAVRQAMADAATSGLADRPLTALRAALLPVHVAATSEA